MTVKRRKDHKTHNVKNNEDVIVKPLKGSSTSSDTKKESIIPYKRIAIRFALLVLSMVALNIYTQWTSNETFAKAVEILPQKIYNVTCSKDYITERRKFPECVPTWCGRVVMDTVISEDEASHLLRMAKSGLALGGSSGGASILDIHSGALSRGDKFINIYTLMKEGSESVFHEKDFQVYRQVKNKIHSTISSVFGMKKDSLHLTSPTFFSEMTTKPAKTVHDEYWHIHTDKETYGSFHYTSLLYLTTYNKDFTGGRFTFVDSGKNMTVEPKLGRLSFFTSGSENPHFVEKMASGVRYAITVSFTCDPDKAIADPTLKS